MSRRPRKLDAANECIKQKSCKPLTYSCNRQKECRDSLVSLKAERKEKTMKRNSINGHTGVKRILIVLTISTRRSMLELDHLLAIW